MRRREFIALVGSAAATWPLAARAQQPSGMKRVGVLMGTDQTAPDNKARIAAFRQRLQDLGWTEGQNIQIEIRWGEGDADRIKTYADELVGMGPDVLVANGGPPMAEFRRLTSTIPIVFVQVPDPVGLGLVTNLAHPGGNITGFTHFEFAIGSKWLELLKEIAPRISRIAFLLPPEHPAWPGFLHTIEAAASSAGVDVTPAGVHDATEIKGAVDAFALKPNSGLMVLPSPPTTVNGDLIITLAARHGLPAIYPFRYFPERGGLMSYGVNTVDLTRRAASYIDRILKGEKPADLPVQAPTEYELVINRKTAKELGLSIPQSLLATADGVIE
jgi:putative ABC transport system substrate-binding protein